MLSKLRKIFVTIQYNGIGFCAFRLKYAIKQKLGFLQLNSPVARWDDIKIEDISCSKDFNSDFEKILNSRGDFLFADISINDLEPYKQLIVEKADYILNDEFQFFFKDYHKIDDDKDWLRADLNGLYWQASKHWSRTSAFDPKAGDIKFVWEPSRFAWVYTLIRAYKATGEDKYAEKFWLLLESWLRANQPNCGPAFVCGQECAIRLMAMCMAFFSFKDSGSTTQQRSLKLYKAISVHTGRIASNIDFAISTRTNHSITEAAGIYATGILFPEMKKSSSWLKNGRKILESEGLKQIYRDGSYLQHSMNYHRLMLQDYLFVFRLAEVCNDKFSDDLKNRVATAVNFLYQMQDEDSGRVPNYGANDGALIIPLNTCDYLDYRPVIQSCWFLLNREKLYENGPWDEDLLWLFGQDSIDISTASIKRISTQFSVGGYYTLRSKNSWVMMRCHSYRDRVGHVDPLHLDLWADGKNLIKDAGSYKYYAPNEPEYENYFKSIWSHNTITIDNDSPLELVSKFTWLPWPKAELLSCSTETNHIQWQGQHFAYNRSPWNIIHSRCVTVENDRWEIIDTLKGKNQHIMELRWQLPSDVEQLSKDNKSIKLRLSKDWIMEISCQTELTFRQIKGGHEGGWESCYYGIKSPICTLSAAKECQLPMEFKTIVHKRS